MNQQPRIASSCYISRALDGEVAIMTSTDMIALIGDIAVDLTGPGLRLVQNGRDVVRTPELSEWSRSQICEAPSLVVINVLGSTAGDEEFTVLRNVNLANGEKAQNDNHS